MAAYGSVLYMRLSEHETVTMDARNSLSCFLIQELISIYFMIALKVGKTYRNEKEREGDPERRDRDTQRETQKKRQEQI